jgi:hypothetical protein
MMKTSKTTTERIFENIIFLADVFGEQLEKDIPVWPVLEMARCFELAPMISARTSRPRRKDWPLWN